MYEFVYVRRSELCGSLLNAVDNFQPIKRMTLVVM